MAVHGDANGGIQGLVHSGRNFYSSPVGRLELWQVLGHKNNIANNACLLGTILSLYNLGLALLAFHLT